MKITADHLKELTSLVQPLDTPERRAQYKAGNFPRSELTKDINKRYRWDLLYAIPFPQRQKLMDKLYPYANDDHIDTALRSIVTTI